MPVREQVALARRGQTLGGVLADEVEHAEARGSLALRSTASSDLSTRPSISSSIWPEAMAPPAHTAAAACRSKPPEKTDNRANSWRS